MFISLNINLKEENQNEIFDKNFEEYLKIGNELFSKNNKEIYSKLDEYFNSEGKLEANKISDD